MTSPDGQTSFVTIIVVFFDVVVTLAAFLFWHILSRIEKKQDDICHNQQKCRENLPKEYVLKPDFEKWQGSREVLWDAINHHRHTENGGVVRSK